MSIMDMKYKIIFQFLIAVLLINYFGWCSASENSLDTYELDAYDVIPMANKCECHNFTCGCCGHVEEHKIHLNTSICVNITYLNEDYGISFTVSWNGRTIYNETVSARNPPPYCVGAPFVKELAEVCMRLHDIDAGRHKLHACVEVEARFRKILVSKYELGCFTIGHDNATSGLEHELQRIAILLV